MVAHGHKAMEEGPALSADSGELDRGGRLSARNRVSRLWTRTAFFVLFLFALALSVVFPYGLGIVIFVWLIALVGALCGAGLMCFTLVKNMLGRSATFGYAPTTAYMAGKKVRKRRKGEESASQETKVNRNDVE